MENFTVNGVEYEVQGSNLTCCGHWVSGARKVRIMAAYAKQVAERLMPEATMPRKLGRAARSKKA